LTGREQGFLLLSSHLGNPERKPLTTAQLRRLTQRAGAMEAPTVQRELTARDLIAIGYDRETAEHILRLLSDTQQLEWYVKKGARSGCYPITRVSEGYPDRLYHRLGAERPGCLWAKGDASLLSRPAVSLVGSRDLLPQNLAFAAEAGRQAARQGYVLISGNARGADKTAQQACLDAGGQVISVVADALETHALHKNILYLSEDGYDMPFTTPRALSRNRLIHALGGMTLVAQSSLRKGGTWDGTENNLRKSLSPVCCFDDGSAAVRELAQMGAALIGKDHLANLQALQKEFMNFIDQ